MPASPTFKFNTMGRKIEIPNHINDKTAAKSYKDAVVGNSNTSPAGTTGKTTIATDFKSKSRYLELAELTNQLLEQPVFSAGAQLKVDNAVKELQSFDQTSDGATLADMEHPSKS